MWSNLYTLADVAAKLSEEEEHHRVLAEKRESKCHNTYTFSEESDKRIFVLFPRKTRSSLVERLSPPPNLTIDINKIAVDSEIEFEQNPRSESLSFDSKTNTLQNPMSDSLPSLVDYNTSESPPNPSPQSTLTVNKSGKRRALNQVKRTSGVKKAKLVPIQRKTRDTRVPEWLVQVMRDMNGAEDAKLIFEKTLFETDVNPTQNRLSMPFNNLLRSDFLTPVELRIIEQDINQKKKTGVASVLVNQQSKKWGVKLKRWEMKGSWNFSLVGGWNDFVRANRLKSGDDICVWSFRCSGLLYFALEQNISSV